MINLRNIILWRRLSALNGVSSRKIAGFLRVGGGMVKEDF
jgi:hypothetical protein